MKYSKELHDYWRSQSKADFPETPSLGVVFYLLDEIERLQEERRWIPVSERLPETRQAVLLFLHSGWEISGHLGLDGNWYDNDDEQFINVTHWMHLPEPPESEG